MKKQICFGIGLIAVSLLFFSCSTPPMVWDENLPVEETSIVNITTVFTVTSFNGIPVTWKGGSVAYSETILPGGEIEFLVNFRAQVENTIYTGKGLRIRYKFLQEKIYFIDFRVRSGDPGVLIRDEDRKELAFISWKKEFSQK